MKIRVVMLDKDREFLERLLNVVSDKYSDKLEIFMFTDEKKAERFLEEKQVNIFAATEECIIDINKIKEKTEFVYLVDSNGIEKVDGETAICKYQTIDGIYKSLLNAFADNDKLVIKKEKRSSASESILFTAFSGGVGASVAAASFASYLAKQEKSVFYLNFENCGDSELYFKGEGKYTLSDVIYALKGKKNNLSIKIESAVKKSDEGVDYFAAPVMTLDFLELTESEKMDLVKHLLEDFGYDYVVIDMNFDFGSFSKKIWETVDKIILVSDGSEVCNSKTVRTYQSLIELQEEDNMYDLSKLYIAYNKFSNKTSKQLEETKMKNVGGIRKFEHANTVQIVNEISTMDIWRTLI